MTRTLTQTPLHDWHTRHGGRMVDFAGWLMPVQYSSIVSEHQATRNGIGLFDVSHMGRIRVRGPQALQYLDGILTRDVQKLRTGHIRYSLVCNPDGGILDDILVYRIEDKSDDHFLLVVNAGNREKIFIWLEQHNTPDFDVEIDEETERTCMISVQGPNSEQLLTSMIDVDLPNNLSDMKYYRCGLGHWKNIPLLVSRTGYTGEDGFELIATADCAQQLWATIFERGHKLSVTAAGLGARDTLRLEAAMPLYGHELSEDINPFQAGLGFAVHLENRKFIGREALLRFANDSAQPKRVGLVLEGRRVPREHYVVHAGDERVGIVTSGTFSPSLETPIAMAYVAPHHAHLGSSLDVDIRGQRASARIVELPFYQRPK